MRHDAILTIPASEPFLERLAEGILERYGCDPLVLCRVQLFLPNRRSCRLMIEVFSRLCKNGSSLLLPIIRPVGEMEEESIVLHEQEIDFHNEEILPAIARPERQLLLIGLIQEWQLRNDVSFYNTQQYGALAYKLGQFLDEVQYAELDMENLAHIVTGDLATHWQQTVHFLSILFQDWPAKLASLGKQDPVARQVAILHKQLLLWKNDPPNYPVIFAGTVGSIPATRALMRQAIYLPQGYIVLSGLDTSLDDTMWNDISLSHPQYALKQLLDHLSYPRALVTSWTNSIDFNQRATFFATLFSVANPATFVPHQHGIEWIEADTIQDEARIIAYLMRETLEQEHQTVMLVTNDRTLAHLVKTQMRLYIQETISDSAGMAFLSSLTGIALRQIVVLLMTNDVMAALSVLKHPYVKIRLQQNHYLEAIEDLEFCIRHYRFHGDINKVMKNMASLLVDNEKLKDHVNNSLALLQWIKNQLDEAILDSYFQSFETWNQLIATTYSDIMEINLGDETDILIQYFSYSNALPINNTTLSLAEYNSIMESLFYGINSREKYGQHPRISIVTPLEARLLHADRMILSDMNLDSWPKEKAPEWMNHEMRATFGLPNLETFIGRSAHDFVACASKPEVFITRAKKKEGKLTTPSPWWLRYNALCKNAFKSLHPTIAYAKNHFKADMQATKRPAPCPDTGLRPTQLSVTDLELWIKDPYGIYAKHILKIKPLPFYDETQTANDYGNIIHKIMERYIAENGDKTNEPHLRLASTARQVLANHTDQALVRVIWQPRFSHLIPWIMETLSAESNAQIRQTEHALRYTFFFRNVDFTIHAKADRLDHFPTHYRILDYKTGTVLSKQDVYQGYAPQLPVEALLVQNLDTVKRVEEVAYWWLKGYNYKSEIQIYNGEMLQDLIHHAYEGIAMLVEAFQQKDMPYYAVPNPEHTPSYPAYEQLERVKEWQYHV